MEAKKSKRSKSESNSSRKKSRKEKEIIQSLQHYDTFYGQAPPGLVQEEKDKPEDCIPDTPENKQAREFLAKAPSKGLWMPLGKEVKVMKCWRCKVYGHRTGDKECPLFLSGNKEIEKFRYIHEDPMHSYITETKKNEKEQRIKQLQALLVSSSSSSDSDDDSSSSSTSSVSKPQNKHRQTSKKHKHDKKKKKKRKSKTKNHKPKK
ncbi:retinitis pigmentosa 9 protein-like [Limulus polyphemus]|uniref:Retinitis pigmentosa 9 protein-like n=1 Tax=Limulus polyphemus TaxID=6850 RepID=A0ABM1B9H4_LIMPO|nr:retinitis pigmentosa 9 protein-like [Limulus polyphemus]